MTLLGSGIEPPEVVVELVAPRTVNASDGIVPVEFSEAEEGPEFSSQWIGSSSDSVWAFARFSQ